MASTAFKTQYLEEFVPGFEFNQALLRQACVTKANIQGNTAVFLVADSGNASAVTRGSNGLIPSRNDNLTQNSCTLQEWHDLPTKTGFTVNMGQADQRKIMTMTGYAVLNRRIEDDIISQLDTATNDTGSAVKASVDLVEYARTILGNNNVDVGDVENMFALVSPAFMSYLRQAREFNNAEYVDVKPYAGIGTTKKMLRWADINWITSSRVSGLATSLEKCYIFHRNSIGHAVDSEKLKQLVGYNEEQDYHYTRTSAAMGSKLLQNFGVVQIKHDGSERAAQ
jgi:hypothetical protein